MTTADTKPSANPTQLMEQRLDALDRALLGILPRSERLALVTQVETRVRELTEGNSAALSSSDLAMEPEIVGSAVSPRATSSEPKRRSRLALTSGILGIVALAMLFAMPLTYLIVVTVGEEFGEFVSIGLLSIHVLGVALGGLVAIIMGIAGLVSLSRRKGRLVGHGWAITGLCTAPLPAAVGGLMVLVTGFSLFAVRAITVEGTPVNVVSSSPTYYPAMAASSGQSSGPYCAPAPAMPLNMPLPMSAAPSFCAPPASGPQSLPQAEPAFTELPIHWQTDIDQALKQAKDEKKLVLVHFYGDSCPPCRAVERKVFPQPQVVQAMMRNYVPVKINVDEDQKTAARYAVRQIPTDVFLVGETGQEAHRELTKQSAAEYVTLLENQAGRTGRSSPISDVEDPIESPPVPAPRSRPAPATAGQPVAPAAASFGPYGKAPAAPAPSNAPLLFADPPSLR